MEVDNLENVLIPQKGFSRFRGIIVGTNSDKFYREGVTKSNRPYKSLRFGIKTSKKQTIYVELFGQKFDKVYPYSKAEKKSITLDWDKRDNIPDGYKLIGVTVGDKNTILTDYDAVDKIKADFEDGDSIFVNCENVYSEYNGNLQVKHQIKAIYNTSDPIDFDAEDFEEQSDFTQEFTITDVTVDKELQKVFVNAYIIEGQGKDKQGKDKLPLIHPAQFVVNTDTDNHKKIAKAMAKQKFGTTMKVQGFVHNDVVLSEGNVDDEWGDQPTVIESSRREMEIDKVIAETVEVKKYKEKDFTEALAAMQAEKTFNGGSDDSSNDFDFSDNSGSDDDEFDKLFGDD